MEKDTRSIDIKGYKESGRPDTDTRKKNFCNFDLYFSKVQMKESLKKHNIH